jgi:ParB-like chromosome segregation protein Spo0J
MDNAGEKGSIIAGHGRVLAAAKVGIGEVPVMVAKGWSEAQKAAYRIADNKIASNARWDDQLLTLELDDLKDVGFDISLMGFSEKETTPAAVAPQLNNMRYAVIIRCDNEAQQTTLLERFETEGLNVSALVS